MDDLLLPGTIPGLLRRGSPVLIADGRGGHCGRAVVLTACSDFPILAAVGGIDTNQEDCAIDVEAEYGEVGLDLSDATGRAHAVWWWRVTLHPDLQWRANPEWGGGYSLEGLRRFASDGQYRDLLADLNPDDDRRLPDGSRWVDAVALARVCRHVAGERAVA